MLPVSDGLILLEMTGIDSIEGDKLIGEACGPVPLASVEVPEG
jgi:hypothetical protein